jgi:predicted ATPase
MIVANLVGGPGIGKSTIALELAGYMKRHHPEIVVEYVEEAAKSLTWNEHRGISSTPFVTGKQYNKLKRLERHGVDLAITDSVLFSSLFYNEYSNAEEDYIMELFHRFNNLCFVVEREEHCFYQQIGRSQNREQAKHIHSRIAASFDYYHIPYHLCQYNWPMEKYEEIILRGTHEPI